MTKRQREAWGDKYQAALRKGYDHGYAAWIAETFSKVNLKELARQEYTDCVLSAGHTDHEIDTVYLRFEREGEEPTTIYLRPDEALSVIWLLSGCLWSAEIAVQHREEEKS